MGALGQEHSYLTEVMQELRGRLEQAGFQGCPQYLEDIGHEVRLVRKHEDQRRKVLAPNKGHFPSPGSGEKILKVFDLGHNNVRPVLEN